MGDGQQPRQRLHKRSQHAREHLLGWSTSDWEHEERDPRNLLLLTSCNNSGGAQGAHEQAGNIEMQPATSPRDEYCLSLMASLLVLPGSTLTPDWDVDLQGPPSRRPILQGLPAGLSNVLVQRLQQADPIPLPTYLLDVQ